MMKACILIILLTLYFGILYPEEVYVKYIDLDDSLIIADYAVAYVECQNSHKLIAILIPFNTRLDLVKDSLLINTYHPDALEFDECFYLDLRKYEIKDELQLMPGLNVEHFIVPKNLYFTKGGKKVEVFNTRKGKFLVPYYFCENLVYYERNIYHENSILEKIRTDNPKQ